MESEVHWVAKIRSYSIRASLKDLLHHSLISMTNRPFHQRFAKQMSSAAVKSDLFVVWYPGLCSKYHSILGSFSDNPADPQTEHIRSAQTVALGRQIKFRKYSTICRRRSKITNKRHSPVKAIPLGRVRRLFNGYEKIKYELQYNSVIFTIPANLF